MFTGLKHQLEVTDTIIDDILPQDNELIKLKKALEAPKNEYFDFSIKS